MTVRHTALQLYRLVDSPRGGKHHGVTLGVRRSLSSLAAQCGSLSKAAWKAGILGKILYCDLGPWRFNLVIKCNDSYTTHDIYVCVYFMFVSEISIYTVNGKKHQNCFF